MVESNAAPSSVSVDDVLGAIRIVLDLFGPWLIRRMQTEQALEKSANLRSRKHAYLYRKPAHPLIRWSVSVEKWRQRCLATKRMELDESTIKFFSFATALVDAQRCKGFGKLVNRLKIEDEFPSASFEAEVAASYVRRGWTVEFVEEGNNRSPDLMVTTPQGCFWVECKCRDELSQRDTEIAKFWEQLEAKLVRVFGPNKQNVAVRIRALRDPYIGELEALASYIVSLASDTELIGAATLTPPIELALDPSETFEVGIAVMAKPDEIIYSSEFGLRSVEAADRETALCEMMVTTDKRTTIRNPLSFQFSKTSLSDKVSGIVSGLKSASGQLPESGPGVVWIRIPDNAWNQQFEVYAEEAKELIRKELSPKQNRRINAVILLTRVFNRLVNDQGESGLAYRPIQMVIEHPSPRTSIGVS